MGASRYLCLICRKPVAVTAQQKYRKHSGADGPCDASGTLVSQRQLAEGPIRDGESPSAPAPGRDYDQCPGCNRNVPLDPAGNLVDHHTAPGGWGEPCSKTSSGSAPTADASRPSPPTSTAPTATPGTVASSAAGPEPSPPLVATPPSAVAATPATAPAPSPSAATTSSSNLASSTLAMYSKGEEINPFLRMGTYASPLPPEPSTPASASGASSATSSPYASPMAPVWEKRHGDAPPPTGLALELQSALRQLFYHYNQRKSPDNRGAQVHLGPSEIGTACDRRLVMSLLGVPACNPGGDGWAAWLGTQGHAGLATMFEWAGANSGRYAVETPLQFASVWVPKGTGDLLDRAFPSASLGRSAGVFIDHKFMGRFSLDKFKSKGPSRTYRVQVHTYAYGARQRGEAVEYVAIVAWPRQGTSLDDLHVWVEPYDPSIAREALDRVDRLAVGAKEAVAGGRRVMDVVRATPHDSADCTYCPFHLKDDFAGEVGCSGKR